MLYKPNGTPAGDLDRLMLMNIWAHNLNQHSPTYKNKIIFAGLGKPTYLLNEDLVAAEMNYWQDLNRHITETKKTIAKKSLTEPERCEEIVKASTAIDYLLPAGDDTAKEVMAKAFTRWYGDKSSVDAEDLIFTVGGAAAIRIIFRFLHSINPRGRVFTPSPYYSLYHNAAHHNHFYHVNLMKEPGFRLSAAAVERDLDKAFDQPQRKGYPISGFLFCDPCNPLGYVVGKKEWKRIAEILKKTPKDVPIILDEAYAEIVFKSKHASLFTVAPELKQRLIIFRSATKGFSASGERMAVILCFNKKWREELINETVLSYAHSPKSLQLAYAKAMRTFTDKKRKALSGFYEMQAAFVQERLSEMNIHIQDPDYKVEGTFYVLADLSALIGSDIPADAKKAIGHRGKIKTDEDICYSLLFRDGIMVAPFSYFGGPPHLGYVRISCCGGINTLTKLLNRLEARLKENLQQAALV